MDLADVLAVHPAQIMAVASKSDVPLTAVVEALEAKDICRRLDEVYPSAQQGDEEAQLVYKILIAELRKKATNYHRLRYPEQYQ
jgi:hypothetical protein